MRAESFSNFKIFWDSKKMFENADGDKQEGKMDDRIYELTIENAANCVYSKTTKFLELGETCIKYVALCGFIDKLEIIQYLVYLTLTDRTHSINIKMYLETMPEDLTDVIEPLQEFFDSIDPENDVIGTKPVLPECLDYYKQLLYYNSIDDSIGWVDNIKHGDLLLISGKCTMDQGLLRFLSNKTIRITEDQDAYLTELNDRLKRENTELTKIKQEI